MLLVYIVKSGKNPVNDFGKKKSTKKEKDVLLFEIFRNGQPGRDDDSISFYFNLIAT